MRGLGQGLGLLCHRVPAEGMFPHCDVWHGVCLTHGTVDAAAQPRHIVSVLSGCAGDTLERLPLCATLKFFAEPSFTRH